MSEWKETTLGRVAKFRNGKSSPSRLDRGIYPVWGSNGIIGYSNQCNVSENTIIIGRVGSYCGSTYFSKEPSWVTDNAIIGESKSSLSDPTFIYYLLKNNNLDKLRGGSGQPLINQSVLKQVEIIIPCLSEQKRIASILSCLDNKIENLRKQNQTLEQIAQTLFKHWFIDFEFPNENGEPYQSSGGAMKPSELGEIPEGWRVGKLEEIGINIRDSIKESEIDSNMSYIGLEHIPRKQVALDTWDFASDISSNKFYFKQGNILFGKLRPYFHKVGVTFTSGVCSTDILVIDSQNKNYFGFLLMVLSSPAFIRYVSLASEGTRMPRTSWNYMKEYPICIPNQKIVKNFNHLLMSFINKMSNNCFHIKTLTKTRDTLLPKLMSGKLRIQEENIIEEGNETS